MTAPITLLGPGELAEALGVRPEYIARWGHAGHLPEPDYQTRQAPRLWEEETITTWAGTTLQNRSGTLLLRERLRAYLDPAAIG